MRQNIFPYVLLCLILTALFIVASFHQGFGYVYIQWSGWQIQSNLLFILWLLFIGAGILYALSLLLKRIFRRSLQKYQIPKHFNQLHPYEKLGVLWLLHAIPSQHDFITRTYKESVLLYPLVQAQILLNQQKHRQAQQWLKQDQSQLFEIHELLKIELALRQQDYPQALDRLQFLTVQPLSQWLQAVQGAYQTELQQKWLQYAIQCPWQILHIEVKPQLNSEQNQQWLQALLNQMSLATAEDKTALTAWYQPLSEQLPPYESVDENIVLLKLISQLDAFHQHSFQLAQWILQHRFQPQVLYIWLDKVLNQQYFSLAQIERQIEQWQQQYPAQPSLNFAQWHIYQRQGKYAEAEQLLRQYPEDAYMAYLRLQDSIKHADNLQHDLRLLLHYSKQDFKLDL